MCDFGGPTPDAGGGGGGFDPTTGVSGGAPSGGFSTPTSFSTPMAPVSSGGFSGGGGFSAGSGAAVGAPSGTGAGSMPLSQIAAGGGAAPVSAIGAGAFNPTTGVTPVSDIAAGNGTIPLSAAVASNAPTANPNDFGFLSPASQQALTGSANPATIAQVENVLGSTDPAAATGAAPAAGAAGAAAGGRPNSVMQFVNDPTLGNFGSAVLNNAGALLGVGTLGFEAANRPKTPNPNAIENTLGTQAQTLNTTGQTLQQPLVSGTLPPGAQAQVDQLTQAEIARIKSQFATMGLSGSTMEASAIAQAQEGAQARGFQIAQNMAQLGLSDMQLSSGIYGNLLNSTLQTDQQFQQALTQFAAAMAGGGGTTIRLGA